MNSQLSAVIQRRSELVARIASQREQLTDVGARFQAPFALADKGVAAVRFLRSHPFLVAGVIAVLVISRRSVVGVASVIWLVWNRYRYFTTIVAKLPS